MNTIITISKILFYPIVNIIVLFILGIGVTQLILPARLKKYYLWLTPWTAIILSIFFLVIASLFGLSVNRAYWPLVIFFLLADAYILFNIRKFNFRIDIKINVILSLLVMASLMLNLSPLIRRDRILTTVSMGNNDVISYTTVGDYLKNHSLNESFKTKVELTVDNLLHDGFRWGTPIANSFFLSMLNLRAYQYTYAAQAVLFSLMIPLIYILFQILFKSSLFGLVATGIFSAFNANLLYMLYHDFFGQVLFWGIEMLLFIFFYSYFDSREVKERKFNKFEYILGILIAVLFFSYHEPAIFLFTPLALYLIIRFILKKGLNEFFSLIRIGFIAFLAASASIVNALVFDFKQFLLFNPNQPIGWQLFRAKIPFANPFEAMGFWSIHNFKPMPVLVAVVLSLLVILTVFKGALKNKYKLLTACYLTVFIFFLYWTSLHNSNFFAYNRALTYTLPFIVILFSIGLTGLFEKHRRLGLMIIVILISFELWSAVNLNKRFIGEHLSVDKSYISILDLKNRNIRESVYAEGFIDEAIPLWKQIWTGYFLYSNGTSPLPTRFDTNQFENTVPDNSLVLLSKPTPWFNSLKIIYRDILWNNKYYRLGHICNADECLIKSENKLDVVEIGKNEFEDSLLISGWNAGEGESRWADKKESTLRLVTKDNYPTTFTVEALSLTGPQQMMVYINDKAIGGISVDTKWKEYSLPVNFLINPGVQKIRLVYARGYRPADIFPGNPDTRTLYVNFKKIALE